MVRQDMTMPTAFAHVIANLLYKEAEWMTLLQELHYFGRAQGV